MKVKRMRYGQKQRIQRERNLNESGHTSKLRKEDRDREGN